VIDADCISIALIEWEKDGSVYKSERPANQLNKPSDIKIAGSYFYVADRENHRVMRWPLTATGGDMGTVVAGGNGYGSAADELKHPESIGVDLSGAVYISDYGNNRLQIWHPGDSVGSTRVGGTAVGRGAAAYQLHNPEGLFIANDGSMYCVDKGNNRVQKYAALGSASQFTRSTVGSGSYHAVVFYTDGSSQTTNSVSVTVDAANAGAWTSSSTCLDLSITGASPTGTITWYFGDGNSNSSATPIHSYGAAGTYSVCLVASDVCGNVDSTCQDVTVAPLPVPIVAGENGDGSRTDVTSGPDAELGASTDMKIRWDVYPNPTQGMLQISASVKEVQVELMDLQGRVIETHRMEDNSMNLDLSERARGTYLIRMIHKTDMHIERVILD
jgi:hypothetical protein